MKYWNAHHHNAYVSLWTNLSREDGRPHYLQLAEGSDTGKRYFPILKGKMLKSLFCKHKILAMDKENTEAVLGGRTEKNSDNLDMLWISIQRHLPD